VSSTTTAFEAALWYADQMGWRVLPIVPDTKRPLTDHGVHEASSDPRVIRSWWDRWPEAGVGIACGADSGLWVLDIEPGDGYESILLLLGRLEGDLDPQHVVRTAKGGAHYYFSWPEGGVRGSIKILPGIDVISEGRYVVAPPTQISDGQYTWDRFDGELEQAPEDLVTHVGRGRSGTATLNVGEPAIIVRGNGSNALKNAIETMNSASEGHRNSLLNSLCYFLAAYCEEGELKEEDVQKEMFFAATNAGLAEQEVEATINSAFSGLKSNGYTVVTLETTRDVQDIITNDEALRALDRMRNNSAVWSAKRMRLRESGIRERDIKALEQAMDDLRQRDLSRERVNDLDPDAPAPEGYMDPEGYVLTNEGIFREAGEELIEVAPKPIRITQRLVDTEGRESLRVRFLNREKWEDRVWGREHLLDATKIVPLSSYGFPVNSGTRGELVRYIAAVEGANPNLPTRRMQRHRGWHGKDASEFYLESSEDGNIVVDPPPGLERLFKAHEVPDSATVEGWREAVEPLAEEELVRLAIIAALSAPLLRVLDPERMFFKSFFVDWSGKTTTGKTTALMIGASVWGAWEDMHQTWDATPVAVERVASTARGVPMFLDETKRAPNAQHIANMVYTIAEEHGRERGDVRGMRETAQWDTVALSSGEQPLTTFTRDGGTRARVLGAWGTPIRGGSEMRIHRVISELANHRGVVGPAFVEYIKQLDYDELRNENEELYNRLAVEVQSGVPVRRAKSASVLMLADKLAQRMGLLDGDASFDLFVSLCGGTLTEDDDDQAYAAAQAAYDWAATNLNRFYGQATGDFEPPRGWAGRWREEDDWIGFTEGALKNEALREFDVEAVLRSWRDSGWLDSKNIRATTRLGNKTPRLVRLRLDCSPLREIIG